MDFIGIETFDGQAKKVLEEANELFAEIHNRESYDFERILDEAADTVCAVANLLMRYRVGQDAVSAAVARYNRRNEERGRLGFVLLADSGFVQSIAIDTELSVFYSLLPSKAMHFEAREAAKAVQEMLSAFGYETVVTNYAAHP